MGTTAALPIPRRQSWFDDRWLLPIEGLVSGALTCVAPGLAMAFGRAASSLVLVVFAGSGAIFGGIIACHFWLFRGVRSTNTLGGFTGLCAAAYVVSVLATILGMSVRPPALNSFAGLGVVLGFIVACYFWLFRDVGSADGLAGFVAICVMGFVVWWVATVETHFGSGTDRGSLLDPPDSAFFWGGLAGALIVCGGVFFLFLLATTNLRMLCAKALVISVACGYLGILSRGLGDRWWPSANDKLYTLYIVWQTGTAGLLAFLLPRETAGLPMFARTRPAVAAQTRSAREENERRVARL
jgi:hypothetical protein